jgi:phage protein D
MLLDLLGGKKREPAECVITVGGREISEFYPFLTEVTVDCSRASAATAQLRFETRRNEQGRWTVQDAGVFSPWATVKIEAAFGSQREEIMRGYLREVAAEYPQTPGDAAVTVECQDDSLALDREHRRRNWGADAPATDRLILTGIASDHGLAADPDSGAGQTGLVLNQDATDITFLRERAEANGYELIFREGLIYFGPMRVSASPQETILVYAGPDTHCVRFSVRSDGHRPDRVILQLAATSGSSVDEQTVNPDLPLMGTQNADSSGSGLRDFAWRMSRQGGRNQAEMMARAQRQANENAMKVRAEGELDGSLYGHVLLTGLPVAVDGVGDWLAGVYYVDRVNHRFSVDGYRQGFTLLRNAYGDNVPAGGSVLAGIL